MSREHESNLPLRHGTPHPAPPPYPRCIAVARNTDHTYKSNDNSVEELRITPSNCPSIFRCRYSHTSLNPDVILLRWDATPNLLQRVITIDTN